MSAPPAQKSRPPSLAPSATAFTLPWYKNPPLSKTTVLMFKALHLEAISAPTLEAASMFAPLSRDSRMAGVRVETAHRVWPLPLCLVSSMT